MQCPVCKDVNLVMTERQNIEIDYCPQCRGIWLDRGELDKIIARSTQETSTPDPRISQNVQNDHYYPTHKPYEDKKYAHYDHRKKNQFGILGELFDFG